MRGKPCLKNNFLKKTLSFFKKFSVKENKANMIVLDNNHNYSANFKGLYKLLACVNQKIYVILCFGTPAIPPLNFKMDLHGRF